MTELLAISIGVALVGGVVGLAFGCIIGRECSPNWDLLRKLEKENAELKEKLKENLKSIADKDLSFVAKFDALEQENAELLHLWEGAKENYNGYLAVDLKKPYKSRSSEQNRMFWGMVQQIASETGNDLEDIEQALKERACKRGFPYRINKMTGRIKPYSMTECNTVSHRRNNPTMCRTWNKYRADKMNIFSQKKVLTR